MVSPKMQDALNGQDHQRVLCLPALPGYVRPLRSPQSQGLRPLDAHPERRGARHTPSRSSTLSSTRGGSVELGAVEQPPSEFGSPVEIFQASLAHERRVTGWIDELYAAAAAEERLRQPGLPPVVRSTSRWKKRPMPPR